MLSLRRSSSNCQESWRMIYLEDDTLTIFNDAVAIEDDIYIRYRKLSLLLLLRQLKATIKIFLLESDEVSSKI